jgi:hypothetical protein
LRDLLERRSWEEVGKEKLRRMMRKEKVVVGIEMVMANWQGMFRIDTNELEIPIEERYQKHDPEL